MTTTTFRKVNVFPHEKWGQTVNSLLDQLADWVRLEAGWSLEGSTGDDSLPQDRITIESNPAAWSIHTPEGEVRLESERQDFLGRRFVELYAWPTLRRVQLLPDPNAKGWKVRTDSGIFLRQEWNRENCILLIRDLIEAE